MISRLYTLSAYYNGATDESADKKVTGSEREKEKEKERERERG